MASSGTPNGSFSGADTFSNDGSLIPTSLRYTPSYLTFTIIGLSILFLITRVVSNRNVQSKVIGEKGAKTVPAVPYWIPLLGHLPNMGIDADGFVKNLRNRYDKGIFALNFGGTAHNVMYTPGLATALLNQKTSNADARDVSTRMIQTVFGYPSNEIDIYNKAIADIMDCYKYLLSEPSLGGMVERTAKKIKENVLNLVSLAPSLVDQTQWERSSSVHVKTNKAGEQVVEANMLPMIRDFCAHTANPTIMGSNFLTKFPDFFEDIWTLDRGFLPLAAGLPRWVPIPALTRAHIARKNAVDTMCVFHEAMEKEANGQDPGPDWRNLDDVGTLIKARMVVYRQYGFSIRGRAAIEHSLMWAANANSNSLIFWMLIRIYSDPKLLSMIRDEIVPYAKAVQPKQEFPIPEPSRLESFDVEGLSGNCPLLKSCYIESLRLDSASWSFKIVKQDFVLQSREKGAQPWLLRKGEYAHAAHDLHNTDPNCFENPMVWKADRHVKYDNDEKKDVADMGSIKPYGQYSHRTLSANSC